MNKLDSRIEERSISPSLSLLEALKLMDRLDKKLLLVKSGDQFHGLLSVGDIQRALIGKKALDSKVGDVLRKSIRVATPDQTQEEIRQLMIKYRMEFCPVVSDSQILLAVYFWEDLFEIKKPGPVDKFNLPVVVMAGGVGTRLRPITNVLPKPLIPLGERTMLEEIFSRFAEHGSTRFFVSVNYKADLIRYYISSLNLSYAINYIQEDEPRGTGGSLSLLKGKIDSTFFVTNCDILINQDYSEILEFHRANNNELTIVAALKHYHIPYGTLETGKYGELIDIKEKPDLAVWVNTGMYILESQLINEIPESGFYHITQLITKLKSENRRVGVFPVSEGSWMDTGEWSEYYKTQNRYHEK